MESWNHNPLPYSNENPWISDHLRGTVGVHCDPRHKNELNEAMKLHVGMSLEDSR